MSDEPIIAVYPTIFYRELFTPAFSALGRLMVSTLSPTDAAVMSLSTSLGRMSSRPNVEQEDLRLR